MLSWSTIFYGAAMSALLAAVAVAVVERIRPSGASMRTVSACAALGAFLGPLAWNAILRQAHGSGFFVDAPLAILPASWQDTGSGVFAFTMAPLLLAAGPMAHQPGRRLVLTSTVAGLMAFLIDVYLY
jgi:hypothetical protein